MAMTCRAPRGGIEWAVGGGREPLDGGMEPLDGGGGSEGEIIRLADLPKIHP
jgi:hypothetical protein